MAATLQVLNGKSAGTKIDLGRDETRMGRHPDCEVKIDVSAASRFHAHIIRDGNQFLIEDLGSRNKTYVNGKEVVGKAPLKDNDRLKICDVLFVFRQSVPTPRELKVDELEDNGSTTVLTTVDAHQSSTDGLLKVRPEAKLRAILEINQTMGSTLQLDVLFPRILDSLFKIFPQADRALLIQRDDQDRLIPRAVKHRKGDDDTARFSRTIVRQAMDERKAMLSADASSDSRFAMSMSLADFRIRSVMCAPLLPPEGPALGVLQVDTQSSQQKFEPEDLQILVSVANQAALALENAKLHQDTVTQSLLRKEMAVAREVQKAFLPRSMPKVPGYEFWAFYKPAGEVGGDYYDFVRLPNDKLAVILGDVSGKGVPAALLMSKASSDAKVALFTNPDDPAAAMGQLNNAICDAALEGRFITLILCVMDLKTHNLTIINAGHMSPIIRRADGTLEEPAGDTISGVPVGVIEDYPYLAATARLEPGEAVLLFSDGVSEAMNADEHQYSMRRLRETVQSLPPIAGELGPTLLDDVNGHVNGHKPSDDLTMVVFSRT